jgi:hypothetical protein
MNCNSDDLETFSYEHYTYINQIFGDLTVREIISEIYPNKKYKFNVSPSGPGFQNSFHHTLIEKSKKKDKIICSVENEYQNTDININDNLCQSYSLLTYFNKPIDPDQKQRQMDMIQMYRTILSDENFINILSQEVLHNSKKGFFWKNFKNDKNIPMNTKIFTHINSTLDKWEDYGYWYFIGDGKCPKTPELTKKRKRNGGNKSIKNKSLKNKE